MQDYGNQFIERNQIPARDDYPQNRLSADMPVAATNQTKSKSVWAAIEGIERISNKIQSIRNRIQGEDSMEKDHPHPVTSDDLLSLLNNGADVISEQVEQALRRLADLEDDLF